MSNFKVYPDQILKLDKWLEELHAERVAKAPKDPLGLDDLYCGAIGGELTYSFTPTSLGCILKVTDELTNKTIDLTDYDVW